MTEDLTGPLPESLVGRSHRRRNPLTGEWVLVSPHRTQRPWAGQHEDRVIEAPLPYDPQCYLCPSNQRANGARNPPYERTYVFSNDYPALSAAGDAPTLEGELFAAAPVNGECRVICHSPHHHISFSTLAGEAVRPVVETWRSEWMLANARKDVAYALIFENRGEMMGASSPHPHSQLWSTSVLPDIVERELQQQRVYFERRVRPLLLDYLDAETQLKERLVFRNEHWVVLVPFWAQWPFELLLLPTRAISGFDALTSADLNALAQTLPRIVRTYDALFGVPFPYSMGWHARPNDGDMHREWLLHAHFFPPLLRSATVRKFQVGFEMLGMPQRDFTPETAAALLRAVSALPRARKG